MARALWTFVAAGTAACVPSVDLALPANPETKAYVVEAEGRAARAFDADAPIDIGLGDDPVYVVALPYSTEELQLPELLPENGPRSVVVPTATVWRSDWDGQTNVWTRAGPGDVDVHALAFDPVACWRIDDESCPRVDVSETSWCDTSCAGPASPAMPRTIEAPVVTVGPVPTGTCADTSARLGATDCAPIAACPPANELPPDLPPGTPVLVANGENLAATVAANPNATLFVLDEGTYHGPNVIDRAVHIWGRCPDRTNVGDLTLLAGGSIARIRAHGTTVLRGEVDVRASRLGLIAASDNCVLSSTRTRIDGGAIADCRTTLDRVDLGAASLTVVGGELTARHVIGNLGGEVLLRGGVNARLEDVALAGSERVLMIDATTVDIERLSIHGVPTTYAVEIFGGEVTIDDASVIDGFEGIRVRSGRTTITNATFDGQRSSGVFASSHPERAVPGHIDIERARFANTVTALETEGIEERPSRLTARHVLSVATSYGMYAQHDSELVVDTFECDDVSVGVFASDSSDVSVSNGNLRSIGTVGMMIAGGALVEASTVAVSGSEVAILMKTPAIAKAAQRTTIRAFSAADAGGIFMESATNLEITDFVLDGGDEAAFHVEALSTLGARDGVALNFSDGAVIDKSLDVQGMFDGVLIRGVLDENLVRRP